MPHARTGDSDRQRFDAVFDHHGWEKHGYEFRDRELNGASLDSESVPSSLRDHIFQLTEGAEVDMKQATKSCALWKGASAAERDRMLSEWCPRGTSINLTRRDGARCSFMLLDEVQGAKANTNRQGMIVVNNPNGSPTLFRGDLMRYWAAAKIEEGA